VVGALRAGRDATRRARGPAQGGGAVAQIRAGHDGVPEADDQKRSPSASIDEAKAWDKTETAHWKKLTEEIKVELPD